MSLMRWRRMVAAGLLLKPSVRPGKPSLVTGRIERMYPALLRTSNVDYLVTQEERFGRKKMQRLEEEEAECWRETDARLDRG